MSKTYDSSLVELISQLTKGEKRYFKLSVQQTKASNNSLFYQLYKQIEMDGYFSKNKTLQAIKGLKASQISNVKKQTYNHILDALQSYHKNNYIELTLRSHINNGKLLYNKSLYNQSLKVLFKAKQKAMFYNLYNIALEIVEFEKYIESQHITNANAFRAVELVNESEKIKEIVDNTTHNLNLSLLLYDLYLKQGFAKNESKFMYIKDYFENKVPHILEYSNMVFFEKLYIIQTYVWYNYMIQDFDQYYKHTTDWVEMFIEEPKMICLRPTLYLKGLHNLLTAQYNVQLYDNYKQTLAKIEDIESMYNVRMDRNLTSLKHLYLYMHQLDLCFWEGNFDNGLLIVNKLIKDIDSQAYQWDIYRELNFYFKIASMYFGVGDNKSTVIFLNKILNHTQLKVHSELYSYAMILQAMAQYELGNTDYLDYFIKSIYRHLKLKEDLQLVEFAILNFVRKIPYLTYENYIDSFSKFRKKLKSLRNHPYEKRAFHFLDIISWLDSKIDKKPIAEVIKGKFKPHFK